MEDENNGEVIEKKDWNYRRRYFIQAPASFP